MNLATGTLGSLTIELNAALLEYPLCGIPPASGTLASATSTLNAFLVWYGTTLGPADGTLPDGTLVYNQLVMLTLGSKGVVETFAYSKWLVEEYTAFAITTIFGVPSLVLGSNLTVQEL